MNKTKETKMKQIRTNLKETYTIKKSSTNNSGLNTKG
jgi:hypothetical protein